METIIFNALGLFFIILLGYSLKRLNLLSKADGGTLSIIILYLTLPAAIIVNLATLKIQANLFFLLLAAFVLNCLMIFIGALFSKNKSMKEREYFMYSVSGYNVGNFTLPFLQSFFPAAVPLLAMFDMGNSIMLAGGTTVAIDKIVGEKAPVSAFGIVKKLLKSVPFSAYLLMLILRSGEIDLPRALIDMLQLMANANTFLSMVMVGLYLELKLPKKSYALVKRALGVRFGFGLILFVLFYLLPLPHTVKIVLCLLCFAPIPTFSVINSVQAGMAPEVVGFTSSISFIIGLFGMTLALIFIGI
ncbi:transporter [Enterococcus sp. JM4C]|uniref:AEC family transporter n=1 Tax=Candidatus Enterococcus huntleyi TaxID=1857217 RepID=UPI001379B404|nr:AEC family transporter [Enterococcus sp. JM4C]KAF1295796.1 transporter [Enterococcus sp. JM4C]